MNRRSFLQLLGLAPAVAVVAKEAVAQSVPEKLAGFDDRGQGSVECAQRMAAKAMRDVATRFDDVPLHSPDHRRPGECRCGRPVMTQSRPGGERVVKTHCTSCIVRARGVAYEMIRNGELMESEFDKAVDLLADGWTLADGAAGRILGVFVGGDAPEPERQRDDSFLCFDPPPGSPAVRDSFQIHQCTATKDGYMPTIWMSCVRAGIATPGRYGCVTNASDPDGSWYIYQADTPPERVRIMGKDGTSYERGKLEQRDCSDDDAWVLPPEWCP